MTRGRTRFGSRKSPVRHTRHAHYRKGKPVSQTQVGHGSNTNYAQEKKSNITPMPKGTNIWDVESEGLSEKQYLQIFQHLEDTGMAYSLQGFYGRTAISLIAGGLIKANPRYHSKEDIANYKRKAEIQSAFDDI